MLSVGRSSGRAAGSICTWAAVGTTRREVRRWGRCPRPGPAGGLTGSMRQRRPFGAPPGPTRGHRLRAVGRAGLAVVSDQTKAAAGQRGEGLGVVERSWHGSSSYKTGADRLGRAGGCCPGSSGQWAIPSRHWIFHLVTPGELTLGLTEPSDHQAMITVLRAAGSSPGPARAAHGQAAD
jgi:hypothetical protein